MRLRCNSSLVAVGVIVLGAGCVGGDGSAPDGAEDDGDFNLAGDFSPSGDFDPSGDSSLIGDSAPAGDPNPGGDTRRGDAGSSGDSIPGDVGATGDSSVPQCVPSCAGRTCGHDGCGALCGGACPNQASANTILTILGGWYLPLEQDSMLTASALESPAGTFRGALAYAFAGGAGSVSLYRLHNYATAVGTGRDHMVSLTTTEGTPAYALEGELATTAASAFPGGAELHRFLRADPYDHDVGFSFAPPAGYTQEGVQGWVYPRFGLQDEELVTVAGAEVSLAVNRVAGGAVWQLSWAGEQMVNAWDFGRQIQIAFQINGAGEDDNPTEAGDRHAKPTDPIGWRHGSPITELTVAGSAVTTQCRPLQWKPENFIGARPVTPHPVLWNGTIGKRVELDFGGDPHVIKWTTMIDFPQDQGILNIELVTAYLNGNFTRFYTYDAATGDRVEKTTMIPNPGCTDPSLDVDQRPTAGGVIIATASGSHALGVYRQRALAPNEGYGLCSFLDGGGTGPYDTATTKWNLLERPPGGLAAGAYAWDAYLVVGTLDDAVAAMDRLYAAGW